ncbi:hypothetical protein [Devosia sp. SD17-2]|uniref:type IV toxin-antitoxin system AbiEi family antitoxin domain-containing protein n=1 Tax=Devosia sp. SD17-2 TaxID=2976459 RepID=UPI0023D89859|nr:hypothetical protein [Devosia sp. SD17-2]WEJ35111.1 hypothetical protein NYQ88_10115 [Devosia sp. SD17-2]
MTLIEDLKAALDRDRVIRTAGWHPRTIREALSSGAVRIVPGVIGVPAAETDPDIEYVVATLLTNGVVSGLTAALIHDLSVGLPDAVDLIVPYEVARDVPGVPVRRWRTQQQDLLTVGVDRITTASRAAFPITSPARTVVDLYRTRNAGYRQHARDALVTFMRRGQDQEELVKLALHFKIWPRLQPHLEMISELNGGMKP